MIEIFISVFIEKGVHYDNSDLTFKSFPLFSSCQKGPEKWYLTSGAGRSFSGEGGRPGHGKANTRSPQRVRGARRPPPRKVAKFHFLNHSMYLKMNSFFKNDKHYCPQNINFSKKNLGKWNIFYKTLWFFRNIILNCHFLWYPINPEKFSVNANI